MDKKMKILTCSKKVGPSYISCYKSDKKDIVLFPKPQTKNNRYKFIEEEFERKSFYDNQQENTKLISCYLSNPLLKYFHSNNNLIFRCIKSLSKIIWFLVKNLFCLILTLFLYPLRTLISICIMILQRFYNFIAFKPFCTYDSTNLYEIQSYHKHENFMPDDYNKTYKIHEKKTYDEINLRLLTKQSKYSFKDNLSCETYTVSRKSHAFNSSNNQYKCIKKLILQNNGKPLENFVKENHRIVKSNVAKKKIKKNICLKNLESYSSTRSSPRKNARHIRENRKDKSLWPSAGVVDSYPSIKISKNNSLRKRYRLINKRKRNSIKVAYTKIHAELIPAEKLTQSVKCIILCFYNAIVLNVLLLLPYFLHILLKQNVKTRQKLVNELWCSVPSIGRLVLEIVAYFKEWREMTIFSIIDDLLDQRSKNLFKTKFSELDFKFDFKPKQKVSQVVVFSTVRNILTAFSNFSGLVSIFYLKLVKCFPHTRLVYTLVSPFFISLNYFISLLVKVFKLSLLMFVHIWVVLAHKCASVSSYLLKFPCRVLNFSPFKINNGNEVR